MPSIFPNPLLIPLFVILYAGAGLLWYAQYWFATRPGGRVFTGFTFHRATLTADVTQRLDQIAKPYKYEYDTPGRSKFLTTIELLPRPGETIVLLSVNKIGSGGMDNYGFAAMPARGNTGQIDFRMSPLVVVGMFAFTFALASVFGLTWIPVGIGLALSTRTWFRARKMSASIVEGLNRLPTPPG